MTGVKCMLSVVTPAFPEDVGHFGPLLYKAHWANRDEANSFVSVSGWLGFGV